MLKYLAGNMLKSHAMFEQLCIPVPFMLEFTSDIEIQSQVPI